MRPDKMVDVSGFGPLKPKGLIDSLPQRVDGPCHPKWKNVGLAITCKNERVMGCERVCKREGPLDLSEPCEGSSKCCRDLGIPDSLEAMLFKKIVSQELMEEHHPSEEPIRSSWFFFRVVLPTRYSSRSSQ